MCATIFNNRKKNRAIAVAMSLIIALSGMSMNFCGNAEAKVKVNIGKKKLNLYVGQTYKFKNKKYSWKSSRKNVVSVNKKGKIKAKKPGTAKITASLKVGRKINKAVCNVKVGKYATGIKLLSANTIILKSGETSKVNAKVMPDKVLYNDMEYSSDNVNVATVDSDGTIRPVSKGTAAISMTSKAVNAKGNKVTASVTVVVMEDNNVPTATPANTPDVTSGGGLIDDPYNWFIPSPTPSPTPAGTAAPTLTPEPTAPVVTGEPTPTPSITPGITQTPTPTPTPAITPTPVPATIAEYIASLKPDDNSPLVGNFTIMNNQNEYRTVYLLNKNYSGMVKLDIDGYIYSGNDSVISLLDRLEKERVKATNSAGTICVHRTPQETLWTVEFLQTGVSYCFDAKVNDTIFNSGYGIIVAEGNTLDNIRVSTK